MTKSSSKCSSSSSSSSSTCKTDCASVKECCVEPVHNTAAFVCKYKDACVSIESSFILLGTQDPYAENTTPANARAQFYTDHADANASDLSTDFGVEVNTDAIGSDSEDQPRSDVILRGAGFFINSSEYIVCPASTVLAPPTVSAYAQRWPAVDASHQLGAIRNQMIAPTRILVTVNGVKDCKKKKSYVYQASLVGVCGAGDVAVLKIDMKAGWNQCNPCIPKDHPHFKFGDSRELRPGMPVYLLGNGGSPNDYFVPVFADGHVCDHRHAEGSGWVLPETVLVSTSTYCLTPGLPILNSEGKVVAMQTTDMVSINSIYGKDQWYDFVNPNAKTFAVDAVDLADVTVSVQEETIVGTGDNGTITLSTVDPRPVQRGLYAPRNLRVGAGLTLGPSAYFMARIVKALIAGRCPRESADTSLVESYPDLANSYWVYRLAYLGVAYDIPHTEYYDVTVNYDNQLTTGADTTAHGYPQVRLEDEAGQPTDNLVLSNQPTNHAKNVKGIRVLGLAGSGPLNNPEVNEDDDGIQISSVNQTNGYWFVPGSDCYLYVQDNAVPNQANLGTNPLVDSPLLNTLVPGDMILSLSVNGQTKCTLGSLGSEDEHRQVVPSILTWRFLPGDQFEICYSKGGNFDATGNQNADGSANYVNTFTKTGTFASMPWSLNYPWYSQVFPLIANQYPNFEVANGLTRSNNFPMLQDARFGYFRPPI